MAGAVMYLVVVDVDVYSEWSLTAAAFDDQLAALRCAAGIAKSWQGYDDPPTLIIKGPGNNHESFTRDRLIAVGVLLGQYDMA